MPPWLNFDSSKLRFIGNPKASELDNNTLKEYQFVVKATNIADKIEHGFVTLVLHSSANLTIGETGITINTTQIGEINITLNISSSAFKLVFDKHLYDLSIKPSYNEVNN